MEFNTHKYGIGPSNAEVKAKFKAMVIDAYKKRGYQVTKHGQGGISLVKIDTNVIVSFTSRQLTTGEMEFWAHGVCLILVERFLMDEMATMSHYPITLLDQWDSTFYLGVPFLDIPKPPSRAFATIEEAEAFFHTYMEWMETKGFGLIDYYASIENMNEELQNTHDIPETPGVLWIGFGMAGVVRYYRGLIIAKLCNKHFEERLEKIYRELNYFIHEVPDPKFNESSKGTLAEFETVLPYIRQIKPIYNL
jgi:hypothetical protein